MITKYVIFLKEKPQGCHFCPSREVKESENRMELHTSCAAVRRKLEDWPRIPSWCPLYQVGMVGALGDNFQFSLNTSNLDKDQLDALTNLLDG